jgi:hypothetical protein
MVEDEWLVSLACGALFYLNEIKMVKFDREWYEWNVDLNLRPGVATREKRSIIGWGGHGVVYGYSRL